MGKRYELTTHESGNQFRIRALVDCPACKVKAGEYGGLIDSETNLKQDGIGWVDYKSKVLGKSVVGNAYITGVSTVKGSSTILEGIISNSTIVDSVLLKNVKVSISELNNCEFYEPCKILLSQLTNVQVFGESEISETNWYSKRRAILPECVLEQVTIRNESADVREKLVMKDVQGWADVIWSDEEATLQHIRFVCDLDELRINRPAVFLPKKIHNTTVQLLGDAELPIGVDVLTLHLYDVLIQGSVTLSGDYQGLYASTIQDNASIKMTGTAQYLEMKEFSRIELDTEKQHGIQELELSGDMIYVV